MIYNLVVTAVSVSVAFLIGGTGLLTVLAEIAGNPTGLLHAITNTNFLGVALILFFTLTFFTALLEKRIIRARQRPFEPNQSAATL
ncbi:hypothetical protein [Arthrobacter sp. H5]|uniref:hypothetical protein n=1 Tax=Arthrobacter sp. H5 TaxID=1267973 RepID=UPI0004B3D9E1|nr:hypothetical protein [Arthrobacter sp. H5]